MLDESGMHDVEADNFRLTADETLLQIVSGNLVDNEFRHSGDWLTNLAISATTIGSDVTQFSGRDYGTGFQGYAGALLEQGKQLKGAGFGLLGLRRLMSDRGSTINARSPEASPCEVFLDRQNRS